MGTTSKSPARDSRRRSPVSRRSSTRSRRRSTRPSWISVSWSSASPPPNRRRSPWTKESRPTRPSSSNNRLSSPSWRLRRLRSPTLSRDKPLTLHDPGQDLVTCKEGLETGGGTIIFPLKLSVSRGPSRACGVPQSRRKNTFNKKNKKTSSDFLFFHSSPHKQNLLNL